MPRDFGIRRFRRCDRRAYFRQPRSDQPGPDRTPTTPDALGPKDPLPLVVHPKLHVQGLELTQSTNILGLAMDRTIPPHRRLPLVVRAYLS